VIRRHFNPYEEPEQDVDHESSILRCTEVCMRLLVGPRQERRSTDSPLTLIEYGKTLSTLLRGFEAL
jgi:hypothetical protein